MASRHFTRRRAIASAAVSAITSLGFLASAPAAHATPAPAAGNASAGSTAIITPLLNLFDFGVTVGIPEGCNTTTATINAGAAYFHANAQVTPLLNIIGDQCTKMAQVFDGYLQQGITASQKYSYLNPYINPGIAAFATGLQDLGTNYADALAPFGPTIAGLGQSATFFEGS
jgi:hypothetical protein